MKLVMTSLFGPSEVVIVERLAAAISTHKTFDELLYYAERDRDVLHHKETRDALFTVLGHASPETAIQAIRFCATFADGSPSSNWAAQRLLKQVPYTPVERLAFAYTRIQALNRTLPLPTQVRALAELRRAFAASPQNGILRDLLLVLAKDVLLNIDNPSHLNQTHASRRWWMGRKVRHIMRAVPSRLSYLRPQDVTGADARAAAVSKLRRAVINRYAPHP
jgi:hypothetical protein